MRQEFGHFQSYLRSRALRLTKTREIVFREIFSSSSAVHPNAYDIHQRLRKKGKNISLATIYRTLNLLLKSGLVSAVDLGESHSHFEPEGSKTAHGHLICLACGKVQEFSQADIRGAIDRVGREKGYRLDKFSIQVFGFCQDCKKT